MNKHTRTLVEAARAVVLDIDDCIPGNAGLKALLVTALKPFDRAAEVKLAWSYDGNTYSCEIVGHRYEVHANGNEPERSSIRWVAQVSDTVEGVRWLSDGEPRCRDAKALCVRHAQRVAAAKSTERSAAPAAFEVVDRRNDTRASMSGCWHARVQVNGAIYCVGTLKDIQRGKNAGKGVKLYGYVRSGAKDLLGTNGMGRYVAVTADVTEADLLKLAGLIGVQS